MKFSLDEPEGACIVRSYGPGYVKLSVPVYPDGRAELSEEDPREEKGLQTVRQSVIVLPSRVEEWAPTSFLELEKSHFQSLLKLEPEVVIVGTGERLYLPSPSLMEPLLRQQVGVEFMNTPAACRTYNILVGERRRVIAALLMI